MKFDELHLAHFLAAIEEIEEGGVPNGFHSTTYDVVHEGKRYPPKFVFSRAYRIAAGTELPHQDFTGGDDSPAFHAMRKAGVVVELKPHGILKQKESTRRVWVIAAGSHRSEWPNWMESEEMSMGFGEHPRDIREFSSHAGLLDWLSGRTAERRPTNDALALWEFCNEIQIGDFVLVKSGRHDWLGFGEVASDYRYEESRSNYCHRRRVVWVKTGEWKRATRHPLKTLTEITSYEKSDEGFSWEQELEKFYGGSMPRYWLFHGNQKRYDFRAALEGDSLEWYAANQHRDRLQKGDQALLWLTGKEGGVSAVLGVEGAAEQRESVDGEWLDAAPAKGYFVPVQVLEDFHRTPLPQERAQLEPLLAPLFPRRQGTNFEISPGQFHLLNQLATKKNTTMTNDQLEALAGVLKQFFMQIHMGDLKTKHYPDHIGPAELQLSFGKDNQARVPWLALTKHNVDISEGIYPVLLYYRNLKVLVLSCGVSEENKAGQQWPESMVADLPRIKERFPSADRYGASFLVSNYAVKWDQGSPQIFENGAPRTLEQIAQTVLELTKQYLNLSEVNMNMVEEPNVPYGKGNDQDMSLAENTILYGPPGTGKTYAFQHTYQGRYESEEVLGRSQLLTAIAEDMKWREVVAAVLMELGPSVMQEIMQHELMLAKGESSSSKNPQATVSTTLLEHLSRDCTASNIKSRRAPYLFWLEKSSGTSVYSIDPSSQEEVALEVEGWREKIAEAGVHRQSKQLRWEFVTFHQSFSYEDFVEGIKPVMEEEDSGLAYSIQDGVFKTICQQAERDPSRRYALFIDEINRGNVASIFGELITLIEPDKRIGQENEVKVRLPYSKTEFGVPSNLDIFGTMNTADRSVEALDSALRRRFTFQEVGPDPALLKGGLIEGVNLELLLTTINDRVEHLLDRDHCIGHSYLYDLRNGGDLQELRTVFARNIVPLLQEYFYGDLGKIGLVLGSDFVHLKQGKSVDFADFQHEDRDLFLEREVYVLVDPMTVSAAAYRAIYA